MGANTIAEFMKHTNQKKFALVAILLTSMIVGGCAQIDPNKRVVFLDGAGYFGAGPSVKRGLRMAGYNGQFRGFVWTSFSTMGCRPSDRSTQHVKRQEPRRVHPAILPRAT